MVSEEKLAVKSLSKHFGTTAAINDVSFEVYEGEFFTMVGPSGCGKTTMLRCIVGLEEPDSGTISLGGKNMLGVPTYRRDVSLVFQDLALFPNMNVFNNIAYGLRIKNYPADKIQKEVEETMRFVRLEGLGGRQIGELSQGQRHRVALARSLVVRPSLILFDEPIAAADLKLRQTLLAEIKALHRQLGFTAIYVTHDQEQAMVLADRIMVMNSGRIEQIGTPEQIYSNPKNPFIATFLGEINMLNAEVISINKTFATLKTEIGEFTAALRSEAVTSKGNRVFYGIRPEKVLIGELAQECLNKTEVEVVGRNYRGSNVEYLCRISDGCDFKVKVLGRAAVGSQKLVEQKVTVGWSPNDSIILEE